MLRKCKLNPYKNGDRVIVIDGSEGVVCFVYGDTVNVRHCLGGLIICHYDGIRALEKRV